MNTVILVEGTWGGDAWAAEGTPFRELLRSAGFVVIRFEGWSENVDGVPNVLEHGGHRDWIAGGFALRYFLRDLPLEDRNILCHSHGLQPVLYQLADDLGVPIRRLLSICSPVRRDMQTTAAAAAPKVEQWRHVASTDWDPMQRLGELFDGHLGWVREWHLPGATNVTNLRIPHIGHSKLLTDTADFPLWHDDGLLDFLRAAPEEVPLGV